MKRSSIAAVLSGTFILLLGGCGALTLFVNQTASLGGNTAGGRGAFLVLIINNTPYRAAFVTGSYDQTDQDSVPDYSVFPRGDEDGVLEGNAQTQFQVRCARVFSLGSSRLNAFIRENADLSGISEEEIDEALIVGIELLDVADDGTLTSQGFAPPREVLLGADFNCGSLLIFRIEFDDFGPNPFKVEYEFVPSPNGR